MNQKLLMGSVTILIGYLFVGTLAIHLPVCHFLMRDFNGVYVEVMRKCPTGLSLLKLFLEAKL
jgi:hypothetical protein